MKKTASIAGVVAMALATVAAGVAPSAAAPLGPMQPGLHADGVQQIQYRRGGYYRSGNYHYYNGHRGYNYYRPGYRNYNGWWFPGAAFAAGALVGGAIAAQPRYAPPQAYEAQDHVAWCYSQYRSYRASDNTFQPYGGPRQPCVSPY